jgi:threonylcarbamoyladenosine tRNA methylthiotransferase MtaB
MKVHLKTLGCRLNQGEIDRMARQFAGQGHHITATLEGADLVVINTCAVTQEATRSSRQTIHRSHRANPQAEIAVTGCYAHIAPDEIRAIDGVSHVIDNLGKESLVSIITGQPLAEPETFDAEPFSRDALIGAGGRTRAFLKAQDGCDRHCAFCVTKIARGPGRSRPLAEVIREAQMLCAAGYMELVLTGVHLGSYGHDFGQPDGLYHLVKALLNDTDAPRIRLSSLEPWGIPQNFFSLWHNKRLGPHLHLPLQSGSDATLKRMIRRTNQHDFRVVVEAARAAIPDVAIATDVIVGYPGESDAEFAEGLAFIDDMHFSGMHIFRYSPRQGTAAVRLPNHIADDVKKIRADQLSALADKHSTAFANTYLGQRRPVLWEAISGATEGGFINNGYTDKYMRVSCISPQVLTNTIAEAYLESWQRDHIIGVL